MKRIRASFWPPEAIETPRRSVQDRDGHEFAIGQPIERC
jgi:hypothetical protein